MLNERTDELLPKNSNYNLLGDWKTKIINQLKGVFGSLIFGFERK